jgi:hypothetical protein
MKISVRRANAIGFKPLPPVQLDLSSLNNFVAAGERALAELRIEISYLKTETYNSGVLRDLAGRFGRLSRDADIWSFDHLYRIGFQVQLSLLYLASNGSQARQELIQVLEEAAEVIASLLSECEKDYRHRLKVSHLLVSLSQTAAV